MSFIGAHFGLGADTEVEEVSVHWPNGTVESIMNPTINTTQVIVQSTVTAIAEPAQNGFTISPNPAHDVITLAVAVPNSTYSVLDASGRTLLTGRAVNDRIPVRSLSPGAYFLQLTEADGVRSVRFMKQ